MRAAFSTRITDLPSARFSKKFRHLGDILEEFPPGLRSRLVRGSEHRRRMYRGDDRTTPFGAEHLAPMLGHTEPVAQQCLRRRAPKRHDDFGVDHTQLLLEPRLAGANLGRAGLLVQPALDQLVAYELEVLNRIGDVHRVPFDPRRLQRLIEEPAGRTHERLTDAILLISRLLSYENRGGTLRTLTEHSLGRIQPEITSAASCSCLAQLGQGGTRRNEIRGRAGGRGTRHEGECPATADRAS